jgi:4-hydroxyphenylacetate 3-monooxygenase
MGAIKGNDFIDRINRQESEIWFDGNKIDGPLSDHPAFKGLVQTKAALYDLQFDPKLRDDMTFLSPETGEPIGLSYLQPKTKED